MFASSRFAPFVLGAVVAACSMDLSGPGGGSALVPPVVDCTDHLWYLRGDARADTVSEGQAAVWNVTVWSVVPRSFFGLCTYPFQVTSDDSTIAGASARLVGGGSDRDYQLSFIAVTIEGRMPGTSYVRFAVASMRDSVRIVVIPGPDTGVGAPPGAAGLRRGAAGAR